VERCWKGCANYDAAMVEEATCTTEDSAGAAIAEATFDEAVETTAVDEARTLANETVLDVSAEEVGAGAVSGKHTRARRKTLRCL
jgi:hypothetical protein